MERKQERWGQKESKRKEKMRNKERGKKGEQETGNRVNRKGIPIQRREGGGGKRWERGPLWQSWGTP